MISSQDQTTLQERGSRPRLGATGRLRLEAKPSIRRTRLIAVETQIQSVAEQLLNDSRQTSRLEQKEEKGSGNTVYMCVVSLTSAA